MKRYKLGLGIDFYKYSPAPLIEHPQGEWVKWVDVFRVKKQKSFARVFVATGMSITFFKNMAKNVQIVLLIAL